MENGTVKKLKRDLKSICLKNSNCNFPVQKIQYLQKSVILIKKTKDKQYAETSILLWTDRR